MQILFLYVAGCESQFNILHHETSHHQIWHAAQQMKNHRYWKNITVYVVSMEMQCASYMMLLILYLCPSCDKNPQSAGFFVEAISCVVLVEVSKKVTKSTMYTVNSKDWPLVYHAKLSASNKNLWSMNLKFSGGGGG